MVFKKDLIKFKKINVRSLPERLREFYINFSFRQPVDNIPCHGFRRDLDE